MKILWVINAIIPQIADACNLPKNNGGGWLSAFFNSITSNNDHTITVCFPYRSKQILSDSKKSKFLSFPESAPDKYNPHLVEFFERTILSEKPDIVHIFGTEFPHTLAAVKACENTELLDKCVVSIQGLISECAKFYYAGLPTNAIYRFSIRDFLKADNVFFQKKSFEKRGKYEIEALKKAKNVIGRTDWDRFCITRINKNINYFFCNESLRSEFYMQPKWNYEACEKHSVFIPQSYYPLKGFHNLIKAFAKLAERYPDIHIYTTGNGGNHGGFFANLKHQTYYQKYLIKLINKYSLQKKIVFLGDLSAEQMRDRLLKSNVFVLSSSLENSPNSLGEAMILGVPCICSDVGGVRSLIKDRQEGFLYPFDKPQMVEKYIVNVFSDIDTANLISKNAIKRAEITHSTKINANALNDIYLSFYRGYKAP